MQDTDEKFACSDMSGYILYISICRPLKDRMDIVIVWLRDVNNHSEVLGHIVRYRWGFSLGAGSALLRDEGSLQICALGPPRARRRSRVQQ